MIESPVVGRFLVRFENCESEEEILCIRLGTWSWTEIKMTFEYREKANMNFQEREVRSFRQHHLRSRSVPPGRKSRKSTMKKAELKSHDEMKSYEIMLALLSYHIHFENTYIYSR